jgi:hypothetical protein
LKIPVEMDKTLHFIAGAAVFFIAALLLPPIYALICAGLAGIGKELWDIGRTGHTSEWADIRWTLVGGVAAYFWLALYEYIQG